MSIIIRAFILGNIRLGCSSPLPVEESIVLSTASDEQVHHGFDVGVSDHSDPSMRQDVSVRVSLQVSPLLVVMPEHEVGEIADEVFQRRVQPPVRKLAHREGFAQYGEVADDDGGRDAQPYRADVAALSGDVVYLDFRM